MSDYLFLELHIETHTIFCQMWLFLESKTPVSLRATGVLCLVAERGFEPLTSGL